MKGKTLVLLSLWSMSVCSNACLWDQDTLRNEISKFPDLIDVATGRFERNPPLFYRMRLDRVTKLLKAHPQDLNAYDDAGVACDRLGDDVSALNWMRLKANVLIRLDPHRMKNRDDWYRYFANEGTFYAHRWFRESKSGEDPLALSQSIEDIEEALRINPNAHFGRERVQLEILKWAQKGIESSAMQKPLHLFLQEAKIPTDELIRGLSGLVVLGSAWESADVFSALAALFPTKSRIAEFLAMRAAELRDPEARASMEERFRVMNAPPHVRRSFKLFRTAAEEERARRDAFMLAKMKLGQHPDTNPDFWSGYQPSRRPDFVDPSISERLGMWLSDVDHLVIGFFAAPIALFLLFKGMTLLKRRRRGRVSTNF